jgi:hypothetical protein
VLRMKIHPYVPLVTAVLLAEEELHRHLHPPIEKLGEEFTLVNRFGLHMRQRQFWHEPRIILFSAALSSWRLTMGFSVAIGLPVSAAATGCAKSRKQPQLQCQLTKTINDTKQRSRKTYR